MTAAVTSGIILLAFIGMPLFAVIGAVALFSFSGAGIDSSGIFIELYRVAANPTLVAIPLFTFAGFVLAESKAPQRLTRLTEAFLGNIPGGVTLVVLLACSFFTAFTGASGVTIIALGGLLFPMMIEKKYPRDFTLGLLTSSGSLGLLFPPSLPLILYGLVAQVSIDRLFLAGIVPGVLMLVIIAIYGSAKSVAFGVKRIAFDAAKARDAVKDAAWEIPLPFIILIGIYSGVFTVTEAAAVTAVYALLIESVIHKDIDPARDLPRLMRDSMVLVGAIIIILGTAMGFTSYLIDEQIPMQLLGFMRQYIKDPFTFLVALNLFLLVVGCMMDIFSAIIVVVPLIVPIAQSFGVDMLHLGIIFLTNLEIGYSTPPVGLNLFIASSRFEESMAKLYRATVPFLALRLAGLLLITYIPSLSLWLVKIFQR